MISLQHTDCLIYVLFRVPHTIYSVVVVVSSLTRSSQSYHIEFRERDVGN